MANLVETAAQAGNFTTLLTAVGATGLSELLTGEGSFTVFAPTDAAFAELPDGTLDELLQDIPKLKRVVMYHVVSGDVRSDDLAQIDEAPTEEGSIVVINHKNGSIKVNDSTVTKMDILTTNGVIHIIDAVLMPALLVGHS
ncbi:MAG: fasciclin domain-containing protein [Stenomitos frigidus ULC029]